MDRSQENQTAGLDYDSVHPLKYDQSQRCEVLSDFCMLETFSQQSFMSELFQVMVRIS